MAMMAGTSAIPPHSGGGDGHGTKLAVASPPSTTPAAPPYQPTVREMPADERPRERLLQYGPATLQTAELLAIILRVGIPGENAVALAARLLREYGGIGGLARADLGELCGVRGLGPAKAAQLKAALELGRRLSVTPDQRPQIQSPDDVFQLIGLDMSYLSQEQLRVICLDTKHFVIHQQTIYQGTLNSSVVRIAEVFKPAITRSCASIIVIHNHPSGDLTPSPEDIRTTKQLCEAGALLDIELLDHIIVGNGQKFSMKAHGLGFG